MPPLILKTCVALFLGLLIAQTTQGYINQELGDVLWYVAFSLWLYSLISAVFNKEPNIPFLSEKFQEWFTFLD